MDNLYKPNKLSEDKVIKSRFRSLSIMNLAGFIGVVVVNALANIIPINDKTTGEISDQYANLFTPAGLTFSIWGVIYVLIGIFAIYNFVRAVKNNVPDSSYVEKIGVLFFISCIANIGWIFAWHFEILPLSLGLIILLLVCLITIYQRLKIGISRADKIQTYTGNIPFSVYLGWITIATIANTTVLMVAINWGGLGLSDEFWTIAVLAIALVITLIILFLRRDIFYAIVVDWALLGVLLKRLNVDVSSDEKVVLVSIIGMVVITTGIIVQLVRKKAYHMRRATSG